MMRLKTCSGDALLRASRLPLLMNTADYYGAIMPPEGHWHYVTRDVMSAIEQILLFTLAAAGCATPAIA